MRSRIESRCVGCDHFHYVKQCKHRRDRPGVPENLGGDVLPPPLVLGGRNEVVGRNGECDVLQIPRQSTSPHRNPPPEYQGRGKMPIAAGFQCRKDGDVPQACRATTNLTPSPRYSGRGGPPTGVVELCGWRDVLIPGSRRPSRTPRIPGEGKILIAAGFQCRKDGDVPQACRANEPDPLLLSQVLRERGQIAPTHLTEE